MGGEVLVCSHPRSTPVRTALALAAVLTLGGVAAAPLVPSTDVTSPTADLRFVDVAFDDAVTQADRDALADAGATAVTVLDATTYRAALPAGATVAGATVTPSEGRDKLDPALPTTGVAPVVVRTSDDGLAAVRRAVEGVTGSVIGTSEVPEVAGLHDVVALLDAGTAATLAASPAVAYVGPAPFELSHEGERTNAVLARLTDGTGDDAKFGPPATYEPRYEEFLAELGLDGSGVVVAIADDGVDEEHPQLNVVGTKDYMEPHDEPVDGTGHGTHVAGIVGATGTTVPDAAATDADGFEPGVGVAPGVGLTNQNLIATSGILTVDHVALFEEVVADAIGFGANIWNASWTSGEGTGVGYLASGARLDALVRDGLPDEPGRQQFTMAFSAGNSGSGEQTLTAPKAAKNILVLAALQSPTEPALGGTGDPRQLASFSSRGPTADGRIGITVAAPGESVRSTKSLGGGGLCFEPVTDPVTPLYSYCSGTSMASPHAAGVAALVTQWWREGAGEGADPSPALVKALLVNSAVDVQFADIPNIHEGWGRIDLESLFRPTSGRLIRDQQDTLTDPGEVHELQVDATGDAPLKVTLDWLDPAGDPAADTAIVNDLDLELVAPDGTTYKGNVFEKGFSTTGGDADRLEVLENVYVEKPAAGTWTVRVRAHALPADGALEQGDATDQDYTLVVSGLE